MRKGNKARRGKSLQSIHSFPCTYLSVMRTEAPFSSNHLTVRGAPALQATCKAVCPVLGSRASIKREERASVEELKARRRVDRAALSPALAAS
jgi:hypothetical protein